MADMPKPTKPIEIPPTELDLETQRSIVNAVSKEVNRSNITVAEIDKLRPVRNSPEVQKAYQEVVDSKRTWIGNEDAGVANALIMQALIREQPVKEEAKIERELYQNMKDAEKKLAGAVAAGAAKAGNIGPDAVAIETRLLMMEAGLNGSAQANAYNEKMKAARDAMKGMGSMGETTGPNGAAPKSTGVTEDKIPQQQQGGR